jgi:cell division septal protein FtsQ
MRQGRNTRQVGLKTSEGLRAMRSVPTTAPRKGTNSKKTDDFRKSRVRARRVGTFRRIWVVMRTLILASALAGGLGYGGWQGLQAFQNNGFLVLRQVDVVGNHLIAKSAILEKAGLELGIKMPSVAVGAVEASLMTLPGIGEVEVRRMFPSRIEISVKEKEPVAMGFAKGWYGLAPDGARIAGLDWGASDLPVIDGFAGLDSLRRAALGAFLETAKQSFPILYSNFSQLTVLHAGEAVEIVLRDGRLKILVGLDQGQTVTTVSGKFVKVNGNKSLNSLEFLQALMHQQGATLEAGKTVDLRVEGYAYVQ